MTQNVWDLAQTDIWDVAAAQRYDSPGEGMFAPEVLGPTVERLAALAGDGAALELAIGTGRVGIALHETGVPVTGIELNRPMIERLREKVGPEQLPVVEGDMTSTRVPGEFSLVYLVYNTISNLYTQEEQVACFRNAAAHLRPGGAFVIELWVPKPVPAGTGHAQVFGAREGYLGVDVLDLPRQRGVSHHVTYEADGGAHVAFSPFRFVWPSELDLMARLAGMSLESRHADWSGGEFTGESPSHVSVYRLR